MINWPEVVAYLEICPPHRQRDALMRLASGKKLLKRSRPVTAVEKAQKRESIPWLKKELDRVFSIFIRQRDSNSDGFGSCVTCGYVARWTYMDCGHYQPR